MKGLEVVKNQKGLNDVQWDVWRGNYGMYMKQIRANETSQGYWRVGSKDQMYGRFARGFDHAQKKNAIYLDIDDGLFGAEPLSGRSPVSVRVVYFDKGTGAWQLRYDSTSEPDKLAREVTNTDSGLWKELTLDLADAHFDNRGPMESDLWLANSDEQNEIFHMVEIRKTAK
ncbi:MAG: hypothetical protein BWZ10_00458 [candidate division BRC1 bacterium ADurb.BinA364]|nr:MAG: hypothetical protein BWZ10_00458 [candidate division BRC1 bacterium ADurb.BinA364]